MPRVTMPGVSPTLAAPTLCPVYHGIIILCVLYNPKWHPKSPPRPNGSRYLPRLASKVRHRAICGSDNESREPVYLGQHCTPAFILLIIIAYRNVVCWRCYGVGRLGTQKPELLPLTQTVRWFIRLGPTIIQIALRLDSHTIDTGNSVS